MTTDFRALAAELLAWAERTSAHYVVPPHVILRARAALSAQEQGPTDEELREMFDENDWNYISPETFEDIALTVLARWGRPAAEPVPVAERLPKDSDCGWWPNQKKPESYGWCWLWDGSRWGRCQVGHMLGCKLPDVYTHWLPHWALPVPQEGADG
jgi:hypothetical protein